MRLIERLLIWTAFSKPAQISVTSANCGADCTTFTYGPDRQLIKQVDKKGGSTRTIYYIGPHFEVEVNGAVTEYRSHAFAKGQLVFTQVEDSSNIGWQSYYALRDHLGSIDKQVAAMGGMNPNAYSYDTFGRRRKANWANDGVGTEMTASLWNHQGYTGHEMLDTTKLVYMRGRVYDPTLGRFLSRDPAIDHIQDPQDMNGYGYARNNPLRFTDPTGLKTCDPQQSPESCAGIDEIIVTTTRYIERCIACLNIGLTIPGGLDPGPPNLAFADVSTPAPPAAGGPGAGNQSNPKEKTKSCGDGGGGDQKDLPGYGVGPQKYTPSDTASFLAAARNEGAEMFLNHGPQGKFDFAAGARVNDTFSVDGNAYNSAEFGNYLTGYAGGYHFGTLGEYGAVAAGFAEDVIEHGVNSDGDSGSRPSIRAGASKGKTDRTKCSE